jgi:hypothetical protein
MLLLGPTYLPVPYPRAVEYTIGETLRFKKKMEAFGVEAQSILRSVQRNNDEKAPGQII